MPAHPGNRRASLLLAFAILAFAPSVANAQVSDAAQCGPTLPACTTIRTNCCTRNFQSSAAAKVILIPMDRCHQQIANGGANGPPSNANAPNWCANNPGTSANAMNRAYGLVYRLMQQNIPVYWIVNPTKSSSTNIVNNNNSSPATTPDARTKDVDFWVLTSSITQPPDPTTALTAKGADTAAVNELSLNSPGTGGANFTINTAYSKKEFPVRGGAFLIAADDRTAFDNFHKTQLGRTCGTAGQDCYDFRDVWFYEIDPSAKLVWQDYSAPLTGGRYAQFSGQLPVAMRIDYEPPRVAAVDGNLLTNFLATANLDDLDAGAGCTGPSLTASKRVGCKMTEADIQGNELVTNDFNWLWLDSNASGSCVATNAKIRYFLTAQTGTFTPGNAIFFNAAIDRFAENCATDKGYLGSTAGLTLDNGSVNETSANPMIVRYPSNLLSQFGDLDLDFASGTVSSWFRVTGTTDLYNATYATAPNTLRRLMTKENTGGGATDCANHKDSHVIGAASAAGCDDPAINTTTGDYVDLFAYGRYQNVAKNGVVLYSPGNNLTPAGQAAQLRMVLSSLIALPPFIVDQTFNSLEITRSSPIVTTIGGVSTVVQGTYVYDYDVGTDGKQRQVPRSPPGVYVADDILNFSFPALVGHLHATKTSFLAAQSGAVNQNAATGSDSIFDSGNDASIPPISVAGCTMPYDGSCRGIWTTTGTGTTTTRHFINSSDATATTLGPIMLADDAPVTFTLQNRKDFLDLILKGHRNSAGVLESQLGGIDRSTAAVIEKGASVGGSRPTIAYVGSTDGMLHAICVTVAGGCDAVGQELWAYIPRVNLPGLRYNTARIDASPHVLDVEDLTGTTGAIKTVLLFQAGVKSDTDGETPAIYALDVSDPSNPSVLWEYATFNGASGGTATTTTLQTFAFGAGTDATAKTPTTRGTYGLGIGLGLAAGQASFGGSLKNIVVAHTNNGGTGGPASVVTMIDVDTGKRIWTRTTPYPNFIAPRVAPTISVPDHAIPAGPVGIDTGISGENGFMDRLVVGDTYGNLWVLDPETGASKYVNGLGTEVPLFQFSGDYHPLTQPAIYKFNGDQFAVFATGGYHSYTQETVRWGANTTTQYIVSVNVTGAPAPASLPLRENVASAFIGINQALVNQGAAFSQARIVGEQVFITTDSTDINLGSFGTSAADTGHVFAIDYTSPGTLVVLGTTASGASSVNNAGLTLLTGSGGKIGRVHDTGGTSTAGANRDADAQGTGERVTAAFKVTKMARKLWLRTE